MAKVKWGWIFGLGLFGVFAAVAGFAEQRTEIVKYVPGTQARGEREGNCWTGSIAIVRPNAWRCMIGNEIVDPCFSSAGGRFVVCNPNPARGDPGFRLKLTAPLPKSDVPAGYMAEGSAWLVELADGTLCRPRTGAGWEVQGKVADYYCEGRQKEGEVVLLEGLDTKKPLWTAEKATVAFGSSGPRLLNSRRIDVKRVWQ